MQTLITSLKLTLVLSFNIMKFNNSRDCFNEILVNNLPNTFISLLQRLRFFNLGKFIELYLKYGILQYIFMRCYKNSVVFK